MSLRDTLIGLFIALLWGMNFVVIAWALEDLPPLLLAGARFLLVALVGSLFFRRPRITVGWTAAYAATMSIGQFAFLFWAMNAGMPAGLASLILQAQAFFTVILAMCILRDTISPVQVLALLIAFGGLAIIGATFSTGGLSLVGFGLTTLAALSWALGNIVNRSIANRGHSADVGLVVWSAWLASPLFFVLSVVFEEPDSITSALSDANWNTVAALLYLSVAASIVGFGLWGRLLSKYPASKVTPMSLAVPVFGISCAAYFLDESLSAHQIVGIALVLVGLMINSFSQVLERLLRFSKDKIAGKLKFTHD
jgi:O-acetylserine/cysteine efflux transporter